MCEERTRLLCRTPAWEHEGDYTVFNLSYNTSFVLQSLLFHTNSIWCIYQFIKYHIKSMHMWLIDYQTCVLLPNSIIRHLKWICSAYFIIWVTLHKLKIILSYLTPSWSGCALVSVWPLVFLFVLAGFRAHVVVQELRDSLILKQLSRDFVEKPFWVLLMLYKRSCRVFHFEFPV